MSHEHDCSIITCNFELESVLEDFFATYELTIYENYKIVWKNRGEHSENPDAYTYILIFKINHKKHDDDGNMIGRKASFQEFLKSHCIRFNLCATITPHSSLPILGTKGANTFGRLK